jgi:hypothetical protein
VVVLKVSGAAASFIPLPEQTACFFGSIFRFFATIIPFLTSVVLQLPGYAMPVSLNGLNRMVSVMILYGMWRYASGRRDLVSAAVSPEIKRAVGFGILICPVSM